MSIERITEAEREDITNGPWEWEPLVLKMLRIHDAQAERITEAAKILNDGFKSPEEMRQQALDVLGSEPEECGWCVGRRGGSCERCDNPDWEPKVTP